MAKISALTDLGTAVADADLLAIVADPAGTPITKKISRKNLLIDVPYAPWATKILGNIANGDPALLMALCQTAGSAAATPTNIGTSVARCSLIVPPADITINNIRWYGVGATTNVYRIAIYRLSDLARLTSELVITTAANTWGVANVSGGLALTRGVPYFTAVAVNATGTTAGMMCSGAAVAAGTGLVAGSVPKSLPGNLDIDLGFLTGFHFQFAVTSGALPDPANTPAGLTGTSGGHPALWLDNA